METSSTRQETETKPNPPINIGEKLRQARDEKMITVEALATQLRLTTKQIRDIEKNRFSEFAAPIYVRGYLRSYALRVGLLPEEIIASFNALGLSDPEATQKPSYLENITLNRSSKLTHWLTYLIIVGLVILVASWWHGKSKQQDMASNDALNSVPFNAHSAMTEFTNSLVPSAVKSTNTTKAPHHTTAMSQGSAASSDPADNSRHDDYNNRR